MWLCIVYGISKMANFILDKHAAQDYLTAGMCIHIKVGKV